MGKENGEVLAEEAEKGKKKTERKGLG